MQQATENTSESLLGSLCKEVHSIRSRCRHLIDSMVNCNDTLLLRRLKKEFKYLQERRKELLLSAKAIKSLNSKDSTSIDFLIEICNRPILSDDHY